MSEPAPEREQITVTCDECGHQITGNDGGRGSAQMKMGQHKYAKHGKRADGSQNTGRRRAGDPTDEQREARPITSSLRDAANEVRNGKTAPSANDLSKFIGKLVGMGSMAAATHMVQTDEAIPEGPQGDAIRDRLIDGLALEADAAAALFSPVGRVVAPTRLNQRFGRAAVDNIDVLDSAIVLIEWGANWRSYLRQRNRGYEEVVSEPAPTPFVPYVVPEAPDDPVPPTPVPQAPGASPQTTSGTGDMQGRVIGAAEVQAMIARQRGQQ